MEIYSEQNCHMLNWWTPFSPCVSFCVKLLIPSLPPNLTHIFWMTRYLKKVKVVKRGQFSQLLTWSTIYVNTRNCFALSLKPLSSKAFQNNLIHAVWLENIRNWSTLLGININKNKYYYIRLLDYKQHLNTQPKTALIVTVKVFKSIFLLPLCLF